MALSIEDRLAIHDLYAEYCHAIDDGRADDFAACFTADGSLDSGFGDPITGSEALTAFAAGVAQMMAGARHQVTNVVAEGDGDTATGRAYLTYYRAGASGYEVILTGRYTDTLRKVDGSWRFVLRTNVADTPPA